jgi:hypothetical protein
MRYELNRFHSRKNPKRYSFEGRMKAISFGQFHDTFAKFMLIKDVVAHTPKGDLLLADHLWINLPSTFVARSDLRAGTHVGFTGIVTKYKRRNGETDFTIGSVEDFNIIRTDVPWNLLSPEATV